MSAAPVRGDGAAPEAAVAARTRRRRIAMVLVIALLAFAGLVHWASRPQQVARLVLSQTGRVLGLEITAKGVSEYRVRGMPRIVLRDVQARMPGDAVPVLRAERILLSIPWTTLRSRGRDLVIHRIELDAPALDVPALQRWQATRPRAAPTRVPRLTDGIAIRRGRIDTGGWHVESVDADVPRLAPGEPVRGHLRGRVVAGDTTIPFDARGMLMRPAEGAGLGLAGTATLLRPDWRVGFDFVLRGLPRLSGRLALDRMVLSSRSTYASARSRLPFALGLAGDLAYDTRLSIAPMALALRRGGPIPDLDAVGRLDWRPHLGLALDGELARWPRAWPALPAPLGRPDRRLPFSLEYRGPLDLSGPARLALRDRATRFEARLHLPRVLAWLEADGRGTPLPPLDGRLSTPRLEIPGATLLGVDIEIDDAAVD